MYLDTVLLSVMAGDTYVGLYQVAFKVVFALQFLPMAFTASLYPAMSDYYVNNKNQLSITFERAMNYLIIISVPISFGIIFLADKIILIFKSGYNDAILPLQIIIASLLFVFINFPIGSLLNACDKQKINTINMIIVTITSIILNLILISKFKTIGASITVLITNILMFILGIYHVSKTIAYRQKKVILTFLKVLLSSLIMALAVFYLKNYLNVFLVVLIGGIIYFFALLSFKGVKREDFLSIYNSFLKK
jgi:O-antigen/teichoic acid export membrane protein